MSSIHDREDTPMKYQQYGHLNTTSTITVPIVIAWKKSLDEELQAVNVCWEKEIKSFPGMSPMIIYPIPHGQP